MAHVMLCLFYKKKKTTHKTLKEQVFIEQSLLDWPWTGLSHSVTNSTALCRLSSE